MAKLSQAQLRGNIRNRNFGNLYFIFGTEKYLVEYYTKELVRGVLGKNFSDFNYQKLSENNISLENISDAIEVLPVMAEKRCVEVSDLDIDKLSQSDFKNLKALVSDLPETTVLIISQSSIVNDLKKSKFVSFIKLIDKFGFLVELNNLDRLSLQKQLVKWAKDLSCDLSENNAQKIIDRCTEDLFMLRNEMEKLCAFVDGGEITENDISMIVIEQSEANIFEITKAISNGDTSKALDVLDILLYKKEEPIAILSLLSSVYVDVYRVKSAINSGYLTSDVSANFDYKRKEFRLNIAKRLAKNFSFEDLKKCINMIVETDFKLKSSSINSRILLEELISKLSMIKQF